MGAIDIARTDVATQGIDATVRDVVDTMREKSVSSVVVVDDGRPVDIISDRDVAMAIMEPEFDPDAADVSTLVDDDVETVDADTGLYDLVQTMADESVRRIPIVENGELAGLVSISDIVVLLGMELQSVANILRATSPAYERSATEIYD